MFHTSNFSALSWLAKVTRFDHTLHFQLIAHEYCDRRETCARRANRLVGCPLVGSHCARTARRTWTETLDMSRHRPRPKLEATIKRVEEDRLKHAAAPAGAIGPQAQADAAGVMQSAHGRPSRGHTIALVGAMILRISNLILMVCHCRRWRLCTRPQNVQPSQSLLSLPWPAWLGVLPISFSHPRQSLNLQPLQRPLQKSPRRPWDKHGRQIRKHC